MLRGSPEVVNYFNYSNYLTTSCANMSISEEPSPYLEKNLDSISTGLFDQSYLHEFYDVQTWNESKEPDESFYDALEPSSQEPKDLVNAFLYDLNYHQLTGKNEKF